MHNPYRGGTPDVWYSGPGGDLWIEYKWQTWPKSNLIVPELSPLQNDWLTRRRNEGRRVGVIVGTPKGAVFSATPREWKAGIRRARGLSDGETADLIRDLCL